MQSLINRAPVSPHVPTFPALHIPDVEEDEFDDLLGTTPPPQEDEMVRPLLVDSLYFDDLMHYARKAIKAFFFGKSWYCGGLIDPDTVTSDYYAKQVLDHSFEDGVQAVYDHWHTAALGVVTLKEITDQDVRMSQKKGEVTSDIDMILAVNRECILRKIPAPFRGGIIMMYFEFCEGFDFSARSSAVSVGVA